MSNASHRLARSFNTIFEAAVGWLAVGVLKLLRRTNRRRMANILGWSMRKIGPLFPEHRLGRANLVAAFPEKPAAEIEKILAGVWDNLGRVGAEFPQIDRMHIRDPDRPGPEDIIYDRETEKRFHQLRLDGKPALIFAAHLANWELPALVAAFYKLETSVLYRRPNIAGVSDAIIATRAAAMGTLVPTSMGAPVRLLHALEAGGHVAMLVDQYNIQGVDVTFFGRRCKANPLLAQLARHVDCPIHGTRAVRLPGGDQFRVDITEAVEPARDADGKIDVQGTTQAITSVIEGWVREHPEQWLWLHRRWR